MRSGTKLGDTRICLSERVRQAPRLFSGFSTLNHAATVPGLASCIVPATYAVCLTVSSIRPKPYNAERMGSRLFILAALLALVVGVTGRVTYERVVNTATPAYAQDTSSPAPTTSSPAPDSTDDGNVERPGDMLNSGASGPGPVLTLPDGSCIPAYPDKRNGYCYR